jgi:hypothetical protein
MFSVDWMVAQRDEYNKITHVLREHELFCYTHLSELPFSQQRKWVILLYSSFWATIKSTEKMSYFVVEYGKFVNIRYIFLLACRAYSWLVIISASPNVDITSLGRRVRGFFNSLLYSSFWATFKSTEKMSYFVILISLSYHSVNRENELFCYSSSERWV